MLLPSPSVEWRREAGRENKKKNRIIGDVRDWKEGRGAQAEETDTEREGTAEAIERGAPSPCVVEP